MADAKKKKRAEKARRRHEKEKEIARWVRVGENQSDVEAKLESKEPTKMGDDASTHEDWGIIVTSVEHRAPTATSTSGGWDTERRGDVCVSRKRAASLDANGG